MSSQESQPPTDALQQQPTPPLATLHFPDALPANLNVALPPHSTVWTKLHLLLHAHQLAQSAARKVLLLRILLIVVALFAAIPLGILAGSGVFWLVYEDPYRHAQEYHDRGVPQTFYIRGQQATRQEYDYYIRSNGNEPTAFALAIPAGFLVGILILVVFWFLLRPRRPVVTQTLNEQIATIAKDHPEAVASWGGVAVLRVPQLIEQLLDMQAKDARR